MIQPLNNIRMRRRFSALVLLFVWIWCLTTATFALAMTMHSAEAGQMSMATDSVAAADHHDGPETGQDRSAATPECCPEETDVLSGQYLQSTLFLAILLFHFVLVRFAFRASAFRFFIRRLIPLPSVRLHAFHCTYLN